MGPSFRRHRAPDPGPRSRGGVRPGRVRTGAADLDANRHPRSTRRLADDDRAEPGPGCAAPRVGAAPGAAAARTGRGGARARRRPRRRRPPTAGLHLLSPCLVPRRPRRSHPAAVGAHLVRRDLVDSAISLARMLHLLMPNDAEISALLALLLLIDARADARLSASGRLLLLSQQDRTCWDTRLHDEAPTWQDTDWAQIVALYNVLLQLWPSPVVRLNRAVAIGLRDGPQAGLDALTPLLADPALATYGYLSAARADFLRQLHQWTPAAVAYQEAMTLTDNDVELAFLSQRLDEVRTHLRT